MRQLPAMRYPLVPRAAFYPEGGRGDECSSCRCCAHQPQTRRAGDRRRQRKMCRGPRPLEGAQARRHRARSAVGCSGGSIYAGLMALGHDVDTCERMTRELWTPAITRKRDLRSVFSAFFPRLFGFNGRFGMLSDDPLLRALDVPLAGKTFADTHIPLRIAATDLHNGERVILDHGSIRDAVRASVAIPYLWKAWEID